MKPVVRKALERAIKRLISMAQENNERKEVNQVLVDLLIIELELSSNKEYWK